MTLGPVMIDLEGGSLEQQERELLDHPMVGGVILFARNYETCEQLCQLVADIHAIRQPRLLVAVDQEGGRVQRFRGEFTTLPPVAALGKLYDRDCRRARRLAGTTGWLMAAELRAVDVDFSFTPVLDLDHGVSPVIRNRAFHRNPEAVADLAHFYMKGMHQAGMGAVGKHFPGHGASANDSHTRVCIDNRAYEDLLIEDIVPFERMIHYGISGVMPAHVIYPAVDDQPAGFSPFWLKEVLRRRLGFSGAVFSDDLTMEGASGAGKIQDRAVCALEAGCDMVLVCNDRAAAVKLLESLESYRNPVSHLRLVRMHGQAAPSLQQLRHDRDWQQAVTAVRGYDDSPLLELDV